MENLQDEEWIYIDHSVNHPRYITAISNRGRFLRNNGEIGVLSLRAQARKYRVSRVIAENFLITVKRPDQIIVDHITHKPDGMYVNDVLNLRWCTQKENLNFEEAVANRVEAQTGKHIGSDHPNWNQVRTKRLERRLKHQRTYRAKKRAAKLNAQQP